MRLNPDCIRDILIAVESIEYNSCYTLKDLCSKLPQYTPDELNYHCLQLIEANLIKAKTINQLKSYTPTIWRIFDLTYSGHQFLADIRSDTIWNKTKAVAKSIGTESLHAFRDIAVSVVSNAIGGIIQSNLT